MQGAVSTGAAFVQSMTNCPLGIGIHIPIKMTKYVMEIL